MSTAARGYRVTPIPATPQAQATTAYSNAMNVYNQRAQQVGSQNAVHGYSGATGSSYAARPQHQPLRDDYERWYTESTASNRMLLALRSGIETEQAWALERLCRLSHKELFSLSSIPGLIDILFEWPEWFLDTYGTRPQSTDSIVAHSEDVDPENEKKADVQLGALFAPSHDEVRKRRYALEALFVLRNAAVIDHNASELSAHPKTRSLILRTLSELDLSSDEATQFTVYALDLLHSLAVSYALPSPEALTRAHIQNPITALERLASESKNRAIIIGAFSSLTTLLSIPQNASHNKEDSPALSACIRYLPLHQDHTLVDACLNYFYAHLSNPAMTKAFLLNPNLPTTLKLLVGYIISQQGKETVTKDVSAPSRSVPAMKVDTVIDNLSSEEVARIGILPEPNRCHEWLKSAIKASSDEEMTQVEFWTSYKEYFFGFQDRHALLNASDVIKAVNSVYPNAQAMVVDDGENNKRFIIRGITKRKKYVFPERNICKWDRSRCASAAFPSATALYEHIKEQHLAPIKNPIDGETPDHTCKWATCQHSAPSMASLTAHVWTHLPLKLTGPASAGIIPHITVAKSDDKHLTYPIADATSRPPPPETRTVIEYPSPAHDPLPGPLAALLCLRTLYRASFASVEAAPRADNDHFGFPSILEEEDMEDTAAAAEGTEQSDADREGERRGRKAFTGTRALMESIHIKDPALMSWIYEMSYVGDSSVGM